MAYVLTDESNYEDIADAIREKTESSDTYTPSEMAGAIRSIPTSVTGVKGNAESTYRKGNVNLTPANIGAAAEGDMTTLAGRVTAAEADITALQAALAASEAKRMAMYPTGTLTGPVAAFPDGAEDVPVKALTVNIASQTGVTGLTLTHTGKNLLPLTVEGIKSANTSGTWDGNAYTVTGVTHTILTDTDGNVTGIRVSGTPTGSRTLFKLCDHTAEFATILSGCPAGGSADSYELQFNGTKRDFGSGASIAGDGTTGSVYIIVRPGYTASDLVFTPMIRAASIEDSAFEPYKPVLYEIDFPQEAGSVTSGTLDIINGVLTAGGQDYDVTPVDVRTLPGANTFSADAGEVAVTYRADIALYIARQIAEANT